MSILTNTALRVKITTSSLFDPTTIADCELWLVAHKITGVVDGAVLATWGDESGNSRDFTQSTELDKPTYHQDVLNGYPVVRFNGIDDYLKTTSGFAAGFTAGEIFYVLKIDVDPPAATEQSGMDRWGTPSLAEHYPGIGAPAGALRTQFGRDAVRTDTDWAGDHTKFTLFDRITTSSEHTINLDTSEHSTTATNTVAWNATDYVIGRSEFFCCGFNGIHFDGDVAEIIMFSRKLTPAERTKVQTGMKDNYALAGY